MTESDEMLVREEVSNHFYAYEQALMANDVNVMNDYFCKDEDTVRFGISEMQRGPKELFEWRAKATPVPTGRTLRETTIKVLGPDVAVVSTVFTYPERSFLGRQSQIWVRQESHWRIAHAHVSEIQN